MKRKYCARKKIRELYSERAYEELLSQPSVEINTWKPLIKRNDSKLQRQQ